MKNKIIILIGSIIMGLSLAFVFAAFVFHKVVDGTAESGNIVVNEKYFLNCAPLIGDLEESDDYLTALKKRNSEPTKISTSYKNSITCYATEKKGYNDELEYDGEEYFYLNQLGFQFSFTNTISVYVRIHFEDAWVSQKTYTNGSVTKNYITKDKLEDNKTPFDIADDSWVYDEATNCLYLKTMVEPQNNETKYSFYINEEYWYTSTNVSKAFREQILVEVSYFVDIVQANRAELKWGVDFDNLFS